MKTLREVFGERIRFVRKVHGWTLEELAARAEMESSYLGAIERGEKNPTLDIVAKIANGLEIEVYQLFINSGIRIKKIDKEIQTILSLCTIKTKKAILEVTKTIWELENK